VKTVHEDGESLVQLASPSPSLVQAEIDARIEVEQEATKPQLSSIGAVTVVKKIAQGDLAGLRSYPAGFAADMIIISRSNGAELWRINRSVNGKRR
jgi:hypothetical protein